MNKRNLLKRVSAFALSLSLFALPLSKSVKAQTNEPSSSAETFTILHTNDVHGRVENVDHSIGYPIYKSIIDDYRANGNTLVLDAGDATHGTNFANLEDGKSMIELMNRVGVDAMTLGNHEFNYGVAGVNALQDMAQFPLMASNMYNVADNSRPFDSDRVIAFNPGTPNEYRVGIFGLGTPETKIKSHPKNTEGYEFSDAVEAAERKINNLKAQGANVIILLSHLGLDAPAEANGNLNTKILLDALSQNGSNEIDVVIDGHSHTVLPAGEVYQGTLIASTGAHFANIGKTTITYDPISKKVSTSSSSLISTAEAQNYAPDAEIQAYIDEINAKQAELLEIVGNVSEPLDGARVNVRTGETNLANLITDAIFEKVNADVVLTNGGGIRASIDAGEITYGEAFEVLPFGNTISVIEVSGQDIVDALTHGTNVYPATKGAFPQVAGMSYVIEFDEDPNTPNQVAQVKINGQAIDLNKIYRLATNDFMASGGDGYTMFEGKAVVEEAGPMLDVFVEKLRELSADAPFSYSKDGRIKAINPNNPDLIQELTIVHANDVHGHVEESSTDRTIGFPKYKSIIDEYRANGNTLVLDAGDATHGTNFASMEDGKSMIDLMNMLGVQAMTLGNHEFNYKVSGVETLQDMANFPLMASNMVKVDEGIFPFDKDLLVTYNEGEENEFKVGVFGLATPETKIKADPRNTEGYEFFDIIDTAVRKMTELKARGADRIILLSHLGLDAPVEANGKLNTEILLDRLAAMNSNEIDIVIDGHSHTVLPEGKIHQGTLIASTGSWLKNVGVTTIQFNSYTGEVLNKEATLIPYEEAINYPANQEVQDYIDTINAKHADLLRVVGNTSKYLDGERAHVRTGETNLANLITDAILEHTGVDAVITNGGGIRASIDEGEITFGEVFAVLPFGNEIAVIEVTGQELLDALKHGSDTYPDTKGAFLQVAGMEYIIISDEDPNTPNEVRNVLVNGLPLNLNKTYRIATNDFMAVGGDGYEMFKGKTILENFGPMLDVVVDKITALSQAGPINYTTDGRIRTMSPKSYEEIFNALVENSVSTEETSNTEAKDKDEELKPVTSTGEVQTSLIIAISLILLAVGLIAIKERTFKLKEEEEITK